jgi:glycosyltransferase involved in cell wall biosynthesis
MIDISLVIPYYNESSTIETTLSLIAEQSYKPKEVIFVNSSSTDNTSKVIDFWIQTQLVNDHIKYLNINSDSTTPSTSKNIGIKSSNYEWIAFMDCGLSFGYNWLENQVGELKKHGFKPNIISGVCKLYGFTEFDLCAVAHTYGVGTNRVCIPGSLVNRGVFNLTGLFLDDMRAGYDRFWQKKTREKNIARVTPLISNVSYIGINFSSSFIHLSRKVSMYSKPAINLKNYQIPKLYILYMLFSILFFLINFWFGIFNIIFYLVARGYFIPILKSDEYKLIFSSFKAIFLLPIVALTIDLSRFHGYILGYGIRLINPRKTL